MYNGTWEWMKQHGIALTRENYFDSDWLAPEHDWRVPLPGEMEAELPQEIRWPNGAPPAKQPGVSNADE